MEGINIYQGDFGSTKQYAEWIGEAVGFNCYSVEAFPIETFTKFELVVIGSSVNRGSLKIKKLVK